ncbi:23S rRNA (adenine(2503)-C(2))-methyltransferase RlmN, partial [Peptoniphilus sp.]|uniref:23S rRNA (adenine(2503)-C(2))-methyltransferase RlmN n=1 Tax=Peptoniphilus sp. TaxID=1971214 RepID=UPI003D9042FF
MDLNSMYLEELRDFFEANGEKSFRGNQLFTFFHDKRRTDVENSNLSSKALNIMKDEKITKTEIYETYDSKIDDTKKMLFKLEDDNLIEGVLMKYKFGYSQCISTQVGCRMGCSFCASTKEGIIRNLKASEMLGQIYAVENKYDIKVGNIILMGSGEPLDNFDEVLRFIKILHDENGQNLSYRNITISTCGIADNIKKLADEGIPVNLALSLHQANDEDRSKIMPINKKYNLKAVKESLLYYQNKINNRVTIEYTLIDGQNNKDKNVRELKKFTNGLK